ncbi:histone-lysine N-methyltransferase, H3 lysine-9 specific SUVH4 [Heracleum sosnowskyi]|uniref:Histone-lysine N-methyltransferase, H3 lysine-9 specific SUVH4 n=1 Tax=Heracleum sosnowskyi TaxID=360622 RepID=A0AAD8MR60_9APIA|nr:histone-lysine N-methyltransferase, H3 lysine-9 specific SUVH4 [Heracleum sosnowskyi]
MLSVNIYNNDNMFQRVVDRWWKESGLSRFDVYKFRLRRITGQPPLTTNQVHFIKRRALHLSSTNKRTVCEDISGGQENLRIRVINEVDDTPAPTGFKYTVSNQIGEDVELPSSASGCKCIGTCTDHKTCACARLNYGSDFPYVVQEGHGRLLGAMDVVYECGANCGCGPECQNRVSQGGIKYQLEMFRTPDKGWGVRTLDLIPPGAPVCEYTGLLRKTAELEKVIANDYLMEVDCLQTMLGMGGRQKRRGNVSFRNPFIKAEDIDKDPEFTIDAGSTGNVSRFINHSCDPNLFVQCILSDFHDPRLARVFLVASDYIPPLQELSYDYNYALNSVRGPDNKIKRLSCHCGAADCRKRLY